MIRANVSHPRMPRCSLRCAASSALEVTRVTRVAIKVPARLAYGQSIALAGSHQKLGSWDASSALALTWSDGHIWTGEVDMPSGSLAECKVIIRSEAGSIQWQPGPNTSLQVPPGAFAATATFVDGHVDFTVDAVHMAAEPVDLAAVPLEVVSELSPALVIVPVAVVDSEAPKAPLAAPKPEPEVPQPSPSTLKAKVTPQSAASNIVQGMQGLMGSMQRAAASRKKGAPRK